MSPPRRAFAVFLALAVLTAAGGAGWYAWPLLRSAPALQPGMVRTTEILIAPEVSGRMARFLVAPGDRVARGQPVASVVSPELFAAVDLARAEVEKARSLRDRVYAGVRAEQVAALAQEIPKAQAVHEQKVQELQRKAQLAGHSFASQQDLDIARAAEASSADDILVAQAKYAEAQRGPTAEERQVADANVAAAEAALGVVQARAAKMLLRAPATGTIATLVTEPGEAVVPGEAVLTMIPDASAWFGLTRREDQFAGLTIGTVVPVEVAPGRDIPARVTEMRDWGEFATWRAARASGDHDLNTFFLRLDPTTAVAGLEPGETVWVGQKGDR